MELQIKKTVKAGNSSAVILPRSWLNKEVRVELVKKTSQIILLECIDIIDKYVELKEVIGIYLVGSYAREEEDETSDIDILVVTKNTDKEIIKYGIYNILIISKGLLKQKLNNDIFPIGQMIRESKTLLNSDYLESIEIKITKKNTEWYIKTTEEKLKIIKEIIKRIKNQDKKYLDNKIAYTLILRIRTLYIIEKLIKNENYSKNDFIGLIKKISKGKEAYEGYLAVKNDLKEKQMINLDEIEKLYDYLGSQLSEVKRLIK